MLKLLICCSLAVLGTSAAAAPAAEQAVQSQAAANGQPVAGADQKAQAAAPKKICRNLDAGFSHRTEKVCMTAKQWEEYDRGN